MSMQENECNQDGIEVGLSLGSNLGNRLEHLRAAVRAIMWADGLTVTALSPVYETEPVGVKPEHRDMPYLNAVVLLETHLPPDILSETIHGIEKDLGRVRTTDRFAPRTIDIDILYAGHMISHAKDLTLPHPRWAQRRFVLQPLADLRPNVQIPGSSLTVAEHLAALPIGSEAVHQIPQTLES